MNTFHHAFWMYFFTYRTRNVWQYVLGGVAPDLVYFVLLAVMLWQREISFSAIRQLNPSSFTSYLVLYPWARTIDLIGHSFVIWLSALMLSLLPVLKPARPFILGWGVHILIDVLTHSGDAIYLFYPLSSMRLPSPVSYWEPGFWAHGFRMLNVSFMIAAGSYLLYGWLRRRWQK